MFNIYMYRIIPNKGTPPNRSTPLTLRTGFSYTVNQLNLTALKFSYLVDFWVIIGVFLYISMFNFVSTLNSLNFPAHQIFMIYSISGNPSRFIFWLLNSLHQWSHVQSPFIYGCQSNSAFLHLDSRDNPPPHSIYLLLVMNIKPMVM